MLSTLDEVLKICLVTEKKHLTGLFGTFFTKNIQHDQREISLMQKIALARFLLIFIPLAIIINENAEAVRQRENNTNNGEKMKKIVSAAAVSVLLFAAAGYSLAGSKYAPPKGPAAAGCSGDCQDQIDGLNSSQARQDEQINALQADQGRQDQHINALEAGQGQQDEQIRANSARLDQHDNEINALKTRKNAEYNPWYVKGVARLIWSGSMDADKAEYGFKADTDTGYGIGIAGGRKIGNFRAETELATQNADITAKGLDDITVKTMMFNGFYHVPVSAFGLYVGPRCEPLSIYGMAGLGAGKAEVNFDNGADDSETTFAYKVGMGVAYDIAANMAVDLGYEYMRLSDIELGADHSMLRLDDMKSSSINAAFRYSF